MSSAPVLEGSSFLYLPPGSWATVLDCLCARFPAISRDLWLDRMRRGRVLDAQGQCIASTQAYQVGLRVHYFREVAQETPIPLSEQLIHVDEHLVVADKPHFLPVQPSGSYVQETLLARLIQRLGNPHLVPLHRIDRLTAGLVLFSTNPSTRGRYQALFRERQMHKVYEAICPPLPEQSFPCERKTRLVEGDLFFLMREQPEATPNTETRIELLERREAYWRYALFPVTGKRHQLRVHMAALGAGICNDPLYPVLQSQADRTQDDYQKPLKLLARALSFTDPMTGEPRSFRSQQTLEWP